MKKPKPKVVVALAWAAFALLTIAVLNLGPTLEERWRAEPPTADQETDCQIEAMMGGDNPVEVERIGRECRQAANDAFVAPRLRRLRMLSALVMLAAFLAAMGTTWRVLGATAGAPARPTT